MGNTIKTLNDGDLVREYLASFHNKLKFIKTINRQYDSRFAKEGAKNGGTLIIKNPNEYTVTTGATMDVQDVTETTQTLTVATQKHIAVNLSSVEQTMSLDDLRTFYIDPAMSRLAAQVEYDVMAGVYPNIFNLTGTPATTPASLAAILNAGARLSQGLAPENDRHVIMNSPAMAATVAAMGAYFHPSETLEKALAEGFVGVAGGFKWWESNMVPNHTNGGRDDTTPVADISLCANADTTLVTTGMDSVTITAGDVFTLADVYDVNLETKQPYSHLKQWVVRTLKTCDGTDTIDIAPTLYKSGAKQNCYCGTWSGSKALVFVAAGGSGTANAVYAQNLAYHRDAFTFVSADLHMEPNTRMTRAVIEDVSMRLWRGTDIINDKFPSRLDVLYGYKTLKPEWAVRVRG